MRKPRRWRKDFPYYKIQTYSAVFNSWKDEARAYSSLAKAHETVRTRFADRRVRIVVVQREGRHILED